MSVHKIDVIQKPNVETQMVGLNVNALKDILGMALDATVSHAIRGGSKAIVKYAKTIRGSVRTTNFLKSYHYF